MMPLYRFYLDGNLLADEPLGWKELTTSIRSYDEIRGVLITQDVTLSFTGDGYTYLKSIFDSDQVCALSSIVIEYNCGSEGYEEVFRGTVFITSLSFENQVCKTKLEDDSFFARINNNKNIKAYLDAARSKNNVAISAVTPIDLTMFDVCTCLDDPKIRKAYKIFDSFQFLIKFMTDGIMDFASDYFSVGGQAEGHVIQTGLGLRNIAYTADKKNIPYISFFELFTECNKKYNLAIGIEYSGATPILRIEPYDYFFASTASVVLSNPSGVKISTDISKLYAKVRIGSGKVEPFQDCAMQNPALFPENVDFVGFREEEFPLLTQCNTDTTLDLVSSWVISSNVIQHILTDDPSYDEDMVFIEADRISPTAHTATQTDIFNDGNCYYNAFYNNMNTLQRWSSALPNTVQVILGSGNNTFDAYRTVTLPITLTTASPSYASATADGFGNTLELFDDDFNTGQDGGVQTGGPNNYGATVNPVVQVPQGTPVGATESLYIVPFNGNYQFLSFTNIYLPNGAGAVGATLNLKVTISKYDSTGVLQDFWETIHTHLVTITPQSFYIAASSGVINAFAGDYISVSYLFSIVSPPSTNRTVVLNILGNDNMLRGTGFICMFNQGYGGNLVQVINSDFRNIQFDFTYPLSFANFKALKSDTKKFIRFNHCGKDYTGYIKDIQYKPQNNSKLSLLTSKNGYRNNP
jgi:hypothetical protein